MVHSDDQGLRLPPNIAPIQIVIIPICKTEADTQKIETIIADIKVKLKKYSIFVDNNQNKSPGWKFNEWEQKGVPIRMEIGPKDIDQNQVVIVRRDNNKKQAIAISDIGIQIPSILTDIQSELYNQASNFMQNNTYHIDEWEQFKETMDTKPGFVYSFWCGSESCENEIKEITKANIRNIPFEQPSTSNGKCIKCGKNSSQKVLFAKSY
jgi:prolyl-tRNA synthetase